VQKSVKIYYLIPGYLSARKFILIGLIKTKIQRSWITANKIYNYYFINMNDIYDTGRY